MTDQNFPEQEIEDSADPEKLFAGFHPFQTTFRVEGTKYYWTIKAPDLRGELAVSDWLTGGGKDTHFSNLAVKELSETFGGSNFPAIGDGPEDPDDPEFVRALNDDATPQQVADYLSSGVPIAVVYALWSEIKKVAPHWGPNFR